MTWMERPLTNDQSYGAFSNSLLCILRYVSL